VAEEHEVLDFYHYVMKAIKKTPKQNFLLLLGDFNAKVGTGADGIVGPYSIDEANEVGDRLQDFVVSKICYWLVHGLNIIQGGCTPGSHQMGRQGTRLITLQCQKSEREV